MSSRSSACIMAPSPWSLFISPSDCDLCEGCELDDCEDDPGKPEDSESDFCVHRSNLHGSIPYPGRNASGILFFLERLGGPDSAPLLRSRYARPTGWRTPGEPSRPAPQRLPQCPWYPRSARTAPRFRPWKPSLPPRRARIVRT